MYVTITDKQSRVVEVKVDDVMKVLLDRLGLEIVASEVVSPYGSQIYHIIDLKKGSTWRRLRFILGW